MDSRVSRNLKILLVHRRHMRRAALWRFVVVCVCVHFFLCVGAHVCMAGGQRSTSGVMTQELSTLF